MAKPRRSREDAWRTAVLFAASLSPGLAADCVPPPVSLPIDNVTLPSGGLIRRGVAVNIGQPPKQYSFLPNWGVNNSYLYGPKCPPEDFITTADACDTFRGGVYVPDSSSSDASPSSSYHPVPDAFPASTYSLFTEKLTFDSFSLADVVLGRPLNVSKWDLQAYKPQHMLGLSSKGSTLMAALDAAGRTVSGAYGFFWGLDGVADKDQLAGSLVLGGYDRAKAIGNGYTQALTPTTACPSGLMVLISDMVLNFRDGTDLSIFPGGNGGTALQACMVPELPVLIELPLDPYWSNLEQFIDNSEVGRSLGVDWWNVILNGSKSIYDGDLTFKMASGLQLTVPNHQLIVPERHIDSSGHVVLNASNTVIRIDALQASTALSLPRIGRYFFTAAYLMSNPDAGKFTLWQANPVSDTDLVAVDKSNAIVATNSSCQPTPKTTSSSSTPGKQSSSPSSSSSSPSGSGLSSGAIGGIAVGAAMVVIASGLFAWWFVWRRKRTVAASAEDSASAVPMTMGNGGGSSSGDGDGGVQELGSEQTKPAGVGYPYGNSPLYPPMAMGPQELSDGGEREHTLSPMTAQTLLHTPMSGQTELHSVRGYTLSPASVELEA